MSDAAEREVAARDSHMMLAIYWAMGNFVGHFTPWTWPSLVRALVFGVTGGLFMFAILRGIWWISRDTVKDAAKHQASLGNATERAVGDRDDERSALDENTALLRARLRRCAARSSAVSQPSLRRTRQIARVPGGRMRGVLWNPSMLTDFLGDIAPAFARLNMICPNKGDVTIKTSDQLPHRYGVTIWNCYGRWDASEPTLAESIHRALDRAILEAWGFEDAPIIPPIPTGGAE